MAISHVIRLPNFSNYAFSTAMENFDTFTINELIPIAFYQVLEQRELSLARALEERVINEGRKAKFED